MISHIDVQSTINRLKPELEALGKGPMRVAISQALTRAVQSGRTEGSRSIRAVYNIKARDIGRMITTERARKDRLYAKINVSGKPIPLAAFAPKPVFRGRGRFRKADGVKVQIKRGQTKTLHGVFFATMQSGHTGVFARGQYRGGKFQFRHTAQHVARTRLSDRKTVWHDLSINELTSISVPRSFGQSPVIEKVTVRLAEQFEKRLTHEILRRQRG